MGKKKGQRQNNTSIPPVGNGGIKKKQNNYQPPKYTGPICPHYDPYHLPGFPIFPFPARLSPGPSNFSLPSHPHTVPPPPMGCLPPSMHPPFPPRPFSTSPPLPPHPPHPSFLPPPGVITTPVLTAPVKFTSKKKGAPMSITLLTHSKGISTENVTKKMQLKYAKQLSTRANKRKSVEVEPRVKTEPVESSFNLFMNIAQRYRSVQKSPEPIDIQDDVVEEEDEVEEISSRETIGSAANMTIVDDMSICTVDEVGEQTVVVVEEEEEEEEEEGEEEAEIVTEEGEESDGEVVCLGEQKTKHVMSEVVVLGDEDESEVEIEEVDVMNTAFSHKEEKKKKNEKSSLPPMEESIIDLSLDDESEKDTVVSGADLPDFIPLIDGGKKKNKKGKGKQQEFAQSVKQTNGREQTKVVPPSSSSFEWSTSPIVTVIRTKSVREKKRESSRKREKLSLGASPSTVARSLAASTCTFPSLDTTPSKIPLPNAPIPPSPLSHLLSFPPGSVVSSSVMGLIQSRGISTSAPHSQPVNFGDYGMSHLPSSSLHSGVGGVSSSQTLAGILNDETNGVVRDALTVNGIFRRHWEEKTDSSSHSDSTVDPSAAPFRICSYNVLCQKTISATEYLYRHTKFQPHVLQWSHRWPLIQKDLMELNADVFGLQEIQDIHFEQFYEPFMKSLGYMCLYQRKSETIHSDGLGIFVRTNRFKMTSTKTVDFLVPGDNLMNRGNVAQIVGLECLQTGASLIITNTHILFNEKRGDIKLGQIALLMANIHAMRQEDEPVICLGDWNLEPESDLYNYITNGSLDTSRFVPRYGSGQLREGRNFAVTPMQEMPMDTHLKTKMSRDGILYQNEGSLLQALQRSSPSMFTHQIPLTSTYAPYKERLVSTFHKDMANPDFIFYTTAGRGERESRRLRLIRRLAVPPEMNIRQHLEPWPNHCVPSDHIPLMAEFYLSK